jgi:phasin family protein
MSKPSANPFFETDFSKYMDPSKFMDTSKFMDVSKAMGEFKIPGFNVEALIAAQRRNIETLTAANQAAFESLQAIARRQAELARQNFEATAGAVQAVMTSQSSEERISKQAEATKASMERSIASLKELTEMMTRTHYQTIETVGNRVCESIDEIQGLIKTGTAL